jgi:hypothetical protein
MLSAYDLFATSEWGVLTKLSATLPADVQQITL